MTSPPSLDQQLDAYERRTALQPNKRRSTAEVLGYSAAAGVALASVGAQAAVIHNNTGTTFTFGLIGTTFTATTSTFTSAFTFSRNFNWDVDGAGGDDFNFLYSQSIENTFFRASSFFSDNAIGARGSVNALASGFIVGPSPTNGAFANFLSFAPGAFDATTNYFGFRFRGDTGSNDANGFQYGWARARVDFGFSSQFTIFEWAFDNNGAAIEVGDRGGPTAAIPLPGTHFLTLLGLGALGLGAYRKRRDALMGAQDLAVA